MILFYHLPRTAGVSIVHSAKETLAGRTRRVFLPQMTEWLTQLRAGRLDLSAVSFLSGHFAYGIEPFMSVAPRTFTVLRHPPDQILSMHRQAANMPDRYPQGELLPLLASAEAEVFFNNPQVRHLAGEDGRPIRGALSRDHLFRAIDVLTNRITTFGIAEYFVTSLQLVNASFGLQLAATHANASNRTALTTTLDHEMLHAVWSATALDRMLYSYGVELFMNRVHGSLDQSAAPAALARATPAR